MDHFQSTTIIMMGNIGFTDCVVCTGSISQGIRPIPELFLSILVFSLVAVCKCIGGCLVVRDFQGIRAIFFCQIAMCSSRFSHFTIFLYLWNSTYRQLGIKPIPELFLSSLVLLYWLLCRFECIGAVWQVPSNESGQNIKN